MSRFYLVLIVFGFALLINNLHSQTPVKGVKSVRVSSIGYGDRGDSTPVFLRSFTVYDNKGRQTKHEGYFTNQLLLNRPTDSSSQAYYNYTGGLYVKTPQKVEINKYDERDSIVFEERSGSSYFMVAQSQKKFIYDTNGKLTEIQFYENGILTAKQSYIYNAQGLLTKKTYASLDSPQYSSKSYYNYDKKNNLISYVKKGATSNLKDSSLYKYDEQNRLILQMSWKAKNRIEDSTIIRYSENGKTVESFSPDVWKGSLPIGWEHRVTKYDSKDKKQSEIEIRYHITYIAEMKTASAISIDSTIFEFWPNGNIKSEITTETRKGKTNPNEIKRYNENGNLLEDKMYQDETLWHGTNYTYDSNGYLIKEKTSGYGQQNYTRVSHNNDKGLPVEQCIYTPGGKLLEKYFYAYEYY
jgi:hypothetical protein